VLFGFKVSGLGVSTCQRACKCVCVLCPRAYDRTPGSRSLSLSLFYLSLSLALSRSLFLALSLSLARSLSPSLSR
jgi:hypothetical protein